MIDNPCKDCERKGCGAYHDQCEAYLKYKQGRIDLGKKRREVERVYLRGGGFIKDYTFKRRGAKINKRTY